MTGQIYPVGQTDASGNGVFSYSVPNPTRSMSIQQENEYGWAVIDFDASRVNSQYINGASIRPKAISILALIRI